jgi:hypothetical protein
VQICGISVQVDCWRGKANEDTPQRHWVTNFFFVLQNVRFDFVGVRVVSRRVAK